MYHLKVIYPQPNIEVLRKNPILLILPVK